MKRDNLSEIMKRAHQLHKNARAKYPTFSAALRKAWSMEKFYVRIKEETTTIQDYKEADNKAYLNKLQKEYGSLNGGQRRSEYDRINYPASVYYTNNSRGFYGSNYMGD